MTLRDYEDVDSRIHRFYEKHSQGRITTDLVHHNTDYSFVVFKAYCYRDGETDPAGTGYAFELAGTSNVNKTSHIENCETSAVGRALANAGFSPKGARPSREEMGKAAGEGTESWGVPTPPEDDASRCPSCNGPIYDNTNDPNRGRRPLKKCKNASGCGWVLWPEKKSGGGEPAQLNNESKPSTGTKEATVKGVEGEASNTVPTQVTPGSPPSMDPEELLAIASWDEIKRVANVTIPRAISEGVTTNALIPKSVDELADVDGPVLALIAKRLEEKKGASV